jgi:hypothetical protein
MNDETKTTMGQSPLIGDKTTTTYELASDELILLDDSLRCFCEKCEEVDKMKRRLKANLNLASAIYNWERCKAATALRHKLYDIHSKK